MKRLAKENVNTPEYFDEVFRSYKFKIYNDVPKVRLRVKYLLDKFVGGRFLDITCGLSPASIEAAKVPNSEVHAIDFSSALIKNLRKRYPDINYIIGDIRNLPYRDGFFDYVIAGEILEHMEDPEEIIKEAVRVLSPGGILAVSTPYKDLCGGKSPTHVWEFEEEDIRKMLKKYGQAKTQVVKVDYYAYIFGYLFK